MAIALKNYKKAPEIVYLQTEGKHFATITKAKEGVTQDGVPKLEFMFKADSGEFVTDDLIVNGEPSFRLDTVMAAVFPDIELQNGKDYTLEVANFIDVRVQIETAWKAFTYKTGAKKGQDSKIMKVVKWLPLPADAPPSPDVANPDDF